MSRLRHATESAVQDLRYAVRGLRLRPAFTLTVAATLALGIGVTVTMFSILDRLLFRAPDDIVDPARLVQIHTGTLGSADVQTSQPYSLYRFLADQVTDFQSVAVSTTSPGDSRAYYSLGRGTAAARVAGAQVTPSFFTTLGVRPALGRFFAEDDAGENNPQKLAVIGYGFWQRYYAGQPGAIGATLEIGADHFTVVGVAPEGFTGTELGVIDVWLPIAAADGLRFVKGPDWRTTRSSQWLNVYARLKPGANAEHARAQATAAWRAFERERIAVLPPLVHPWNPDSEIVVFGSVIPGRSPSLFGISAHSGVVQVSRLLGLVSLFVLLLACANVANLLLVRAMQRRREIAVRLALGISRGRLARQLLIEGVLLAALGAGGALVLVQAASGLVRRLLLGNAAWDGYAVDLRVLSVTALAALVTALLTSLLPVVQTTNPELSLELKSGAREGVVTRSFTRSALLATQMALALLLLAGAGLFGRSLFKAVSQPFGVDVDKVVVASIDHANVGLSNADALRLYLDFAERARGVPGISASAVSIAHSFGLGWGTRVFAHGEQLQMGNFGFSQYAITPDYFRVMGIRLVAGRIFSDEDREGSALTAIVNETAARTFWPGGDAVGQCIQVGADSMPCTTIVGIVSNSRRQQLVEGPIPQIYRPLLQLPAAATDKTVSLFGYTLLARAERPETVVEPLRHAMQSTSANVPYANVVPLADLLGRQTRSWLLGASMFSIFGGLALLLAAVGLYSVVVFTMAQRRHEYGVRMALGARGAHLVRITVTRGLVPASAGLVIGLLLVLAAGRLVTATLFETQANDPGVLFLASGVLLGAAALACLVPGLRAARTDPAVVLRTD